jgi:hypothetical protein
VASFMYIPTNEERAVGLKKWADALLSNPENSHMPKRYLEGIHRRAMAEAAAIKGQPDKVSDEFGTESGVVPESFINMLAQPIEED